MKTKILLFTFISLLYACTSKPKEMSIKTTETNKNKVYYAMTNTLFDTIPACQKKLIENYFKFIHNPSIDEGKDFFYFEEYATSDNCDAMAAMIAQNFSQYPISINEETFNRQLKNIFGFDMQKIPDEIIRKRRSNNCIELELNDGDNNFWICKKEHIIIPSQYIGLSFKDYNNINTVESPFNKDIIYYNQYVFNCSQSALTWLINNDKLFVETLLRSFGYDKEDKINKLVLDEVNNRTDSDRLKNLFAQKYNGSNLQIRVNLFNYALNNSETDKFAKLLNDYGNYILNVSNNESQYTQEDKLKIVSYVFYYSARLYYEKKCMLRSFADIQIDGEQNGRDVGLIEHIETNNYYNLPGFKELINRLFNDYQIATAHS